MNKLFLFINMLGLFGCTDEAQPTSKQGYIVGGVEIILPDNGDTVLKAATADTLYKITFKKGETSLNEKNSFVTKTPVKNKTAGDSTTRQNLMLESTFEDESPFSPFYSPTQSCCTYSLTASTEKAHNGKKSLRVELHQSDDEFASSKRSEVYPRINDKKNVDRWAAASYYFPLATFAPDKDPELIMQWHTAALTGSPPLELSTWNGKFHVQQCINSSGGATSESIYFQKTELGPISYDRWVDIVVHYKQRPTEEGLVEVWIDGKKVYSKAGPNTFADYSNYIKVGINKFPWMPGATWGGNQTERIFYIDDIRYGNEKATYKDVAP